MISGRGEKIRILHVITRLIPGGADSNTIQTVRGLDPRYYQVDLAIGVESDFAFVAQSGVPTVVIVPDLVRNPSPWRDVKAIFQLARLMRKNRYHIVHTHTAKAGILGRFASALCATPVVVHTLHGSTFHRCMHPMTAMVYRFLERVAGHVTNQFVAVGENVRDIYIQSGVGEAERYVTIRSGFELQRFQMDVRRMALKRRQLCDELGIDEDFFIIGSASRLEPRKGQNYLLQAAKTLLQKHEDIIFLIAGDGPSAKELRLTAQSLAIEDRVLFLGHRHDIEDVMAAMDVFVLSSLWEGLPQVLVQAAALGKPIVTFDIEGAREIVHAGENGFIVPRGDVHALTQAIDYLINDRPKAAQMGEYGKKFVTFEYDKEVMVRRITALYQDLIRAGRRRSLSRRIPSS